MDEIVLCCNERFAASISTGQIYFEDGTTDNEFNTTNK